MYMEQFDDVSKLSGRFQKKFGSYFNAKEQFENRKKITKMLCNEFPNYSKNEIRRVVDLAFARVNVSLRWSDMIAYIRCLLPGTWNKVVTDPGFSRASTMFLMTNGTVLLQESNGSRFKKLTPDANGSYINGSWSDIAPMNTPRLYYASGVLIDGRLIVAGGEYEGTSTAVRGVKCEIYDPIANTWTNLPSPPGITQLGDAPCAVLPDGRFMVGAINSVHCAIFDPETDTWTPTADKPTTSSEESWVLLSDNTILTVRTNDSQIGDKYLIDSDTWVSAGSTPFQLVETSSSEIGAGILMNNGHAFYIGATNQTAIYVPPLNPNDPGTWQSGPTIPNNASMQMVGAKDAPACLMTNGRILMAVGPVDGVSSNFLSPTYFYEFNGSSLVRVADPPNNGNPPYMGRMLLLPNGQILFTAETAEVYAYTYPSCINSSWRPTITAYPSSVIQGLTATIQGTQLNGLSQAVGYGDDSTAATNYPLVRIRNIASGKVHYCRTFNFSTMGVATGSSIQSTSFVVPFNLETGPSEICVVANGISSICYPINVKNFRIIWPHEWTLIARLIGSLADGDLWVLGPNGPVPVDPWGPKYRQLAFEAWQAIRQGVGQLQQIGIEIERLRLELAAEQAGPQIFELGEEEEEKIKKYGEEKRGYRD